jgi:phosphoribosylaminoimidazolecarboxamide formyltransferase/IMP cyclohydrolase
MKNALVSVFDKEGLEPIVRQLDKCGITIFSTGGTQKFIEELGINVVPVEDITSFPSILGGRVKTLHPRVFGGILGRRDLAVDVVEMDKYEIPPFDFVVVDLYPFEKTVAEGQPEEEIIEKIDIGGISLIRAAAKNFQHVMVIPSKDDYGTLLEVLENGQGESTIELRKELAKRAFEVSSNYDTQINAYFTGGTASFNKKVSGAKALRYGENPHQKATFYGNLDEVFTQIHGKELSYNNLLDIDAAFNLISEFNEITFAVIKHNNSCGIASRKTLLEAWKDALAGDPVSAFGGILITNAAIDEVTAKEINNLFFEVLIAPSFDASALEIL